MISINFSHQLEQCLEHASRALTEHHIFLNPRLHLALQPMHNTLALRLPLALTMPQTFHLRIQHRWVPLDNKYLNSGIGLITRLTGSRQLLKTPTELA